MKDNNYEFRVGDEVETVDGMSGKIVSICHCERCAERGFFEPKWETLDGKYYEVFAHQVALHQLLYRKLLKFAYENEYNDDADWNVRNIHWGIYYDYEKHMFDSDCHGLRKFDGVWFSSKDGADYAIKEVVEPFVKEHPEFVW